MGAAASQDDAPLQTTPRPPPLGARPTNVRVPTPHHSLFRSRETQAVEYQPPVQQSSVVRNVVTLNRSTLSLVQSADRHVYLVTFEFNAEVEGYITIYYCAREVVVRGEGGGVERVRYVGKGDRLPGKTRFGKGERQRYRQNDDKGIDVRRFTTSELRYREGEAYPVVIRLEALYGESDVPDHLRVRCQTTFAELVCVDGLYNIQVIAQQALVGGTVYRMQEMYGIGLPEEDVAEGSFRECVICLTEPSNTAVQPCNHLCLCDECARVLGTETDFQRRKCPVCRSQLVSFLRIISPPDANDGDGEGDTAPDGSDVVSSNDLGARDGDEEREIVPDAREATSEEQSETSGEVAVRAAEAVNESTREDVEREDACVRMSSLVTSASESPVEPEGNTLPRPDAA